MPTKDRTWFERTVRELGDELRTGSGGDVLLEDIRRRLTSQQSIGGVSTEGVKTRLLPDHPGQAE